MSWKSSRGSTCIAPTFTWLLSANVPSMLRSFIQASPYRPIYQESDICYVGHGLFDTRTSLVVMGMMQLDQWVFMFRTVYGRCFSVFVICISSGYFGIIIITSIYYIITLVFFEEEVMRDRVDTKLVYEANMWWFNPRYTLRANTINTPSLLHTTKRMDT